MELRAPQKIETARLNLRQFNEEDWKALHDYYGNAEAVTFTTVKPLSDTATWRMMCTMIGHWYARGYGPYAVIEKELNRLIGVVGYWYPLEWPAPEIKWAIIPEFQGKGYASEAARACLAEGKKALPEINFISVIHVENQPSRNLAEALGASVEHEFSFRGGPHLIYRHAEA